MQRSEPINQRPDRFTQTLVREELVAPERVASAGHRDLHPYSDPIGGDPVNVTSVNLTSVCQAFVCQAFVTRG